jgi:hypothetical protein
MSGLVSGANGPSSVGGNSASVVSGDGNFK